MMARLKSFVQCLGQPGRCTSNGEEMRKRNAQHGLVSSVHSTEQSHHGGLQDRPPSRPEPLVISAMTSPNVTRLGDQALASSHNAPRHLRKKDSSERTNMLFNSPDWGGPNSGEISQDSSLAVPLAKTVNSSDIQKLMPLPRVLNLPLNPGSSQTIMNVLQSSGHANSTGIVEPAQGAEMLSGQPASGAWEWQTVSCECGFAGTVRKDLQDTKPPNCPACLTPVPTSRTTALTEQEVKKQLLLRNSTTSSANSTPGSPTSPRSSQEALTPKTPTSVAAVKSQTVESNAVSSPLTSNRSRTEIFSRTRTGREAQNPLLLENEGSTSVVPTGAVQESSDIGAGGETSLRGAHEKEEIQHFPNLQLPPVVASDSKTGAPDAVQSPQIRANAGKGNATRNLLSGEISLLEIATSKLAQMAEMAAAAGHPHMSKPAALAVIPEHEVRYTAAKSNTTASSQVASLASRFQSLCTPRSSLSAQTFESIPEGAIEGDWVTVIRNGQGV